MSWPYEEMTVWVWLVHHVIHLIHCNELTIWRDDCVSVTSSPCVHHVHQLRSSTVNTMLDHPDKLKSCPFDATSPRLTVWQYICDRQIYYALGNFDGHLKRICLWLHDCGSYQVCQSVSNIVKVQTPSLPRTSPLLSSYSPPFHSSPFPSPEK